MRIASAMASARGLSPEDADTVRRLVDEWRNHYQRNRLRDAYYFGNVRVKDIGVSVSPAIARKLSPHVDWAAKCVDWWADRVQFDGITCEDEQAGESLSGIFARNDMKNLAHKSVSTALRHSFGLLAVTAGDVESGEPSTVISGYPATASSAIWDEAKKRIMAGLVVVESEKMRGSEQRIPRLVYVFTDESLIVLSRAGGSSWHADYTPHGMGRVPMEPIAYHATLERPFGRSRITRTVMSLVDDAQREMLNMTAAAAFAAAPQKYLLGADKTTAEKISETPFAAFIGSVFIGTTNSKGQIPQYGQLAQMSMQPHVEYMRSLAAQFSGTTGVPLSSLGIVSDNPSSAEAIYAGKEDAVVDISHFIDACKRSLSSIAVMALANEAGTDYQTAFASAGTIDVNFRSPAMPSVVSQSDAIVKQISAIPWLASSDVALRELGYTDEQINQLRSDRRKAMGSATAANIAYGHGAQPLLPEAPDGE